MKVRVVISVRALRCCRRYFGYTFALVGKTTLIIPIVMIGRTTLTTSLVMIDKTTYNTTCNDL